jgi:uncharacterized protein YdcH (DUF465 family)
MTDPKDTRERLMREDPNYRRLGHKHEEYEQRLAELQSKKFLSEEEKTEETKLKKLKLRAKDEMETLVRHHLETRKPVGS